MTSTSPAHPAPARDRLEGRAAPTVRMIAAHTRVAVLEAIREPIVIVSTAVFPALILACFVIPQEYVASNAERATSAAGQVALFSVVSVCLFTYGAGIAEERARPFDTYLRGLPTGALPQMLGRVGTGVVLSSFGLVPVAVLAGLFTEATLSLGRLPLVLATILACGIPFLAIGFAIGYSLRQKAALAVAQLVLFPMAFLGGLFIPPETFPRWLDAVSQAMPTRAARDLVVASLDAGSAGLQEVGVLAAWTTVATLLTVWAFRRDEGRRFR